MLAVVLSLMLLISAALVAVPIVSGLICSYFTHQETIYIDVSSVTGWDESGANIRVYTYYGDSNEDWNVENNKADSQIYNNACFQHAIAPTKIANDLYSFNIQGDKVGYVKVMRLDTGMSTVWNTTGFAYNKDRSGSANCIKITGWDNSYQWTTYSPSGGTGYHEVNANPDATSITNNANIFPIDATFYDYYTDTEVSGGWGNINYVNSHGDWEPYTTLNNKIASASSGVNYPMYFGNFFDKNDGYTGAGSSNMVNFSNWVNNSARLGGTHKAVVGLTGSSLVNNNLVYAVNGGGNSSVKVPFFDKSFLQSNGVGSVVNTKFPMRKVTENGITTYIFDSEGANDNAWFSTDKKTMYYGQGTSKGAKDALYYYSNPQAASGYGFFPFDSNRGANSEALNFGFGMRVDVPFNLGGDTGHYGQIKGTNGSYVDQKFTFTGDDDVWVYIDGNLVLDLGGDHQKAEGTINFAGGRGTGTVSVTYGSNTLNSATRNTSFSINNYDPTVEHTLTMFYVERGMVESNLSFDFNFAPIGNELIVDKTVNTASVNSGTGFADAVKAADTFSFNQPTANGKLSSKGTISNSTYTLKNSESISFKDQFAVPTDMTVTESVPSSSFSYTTSWKAVDLVLKGKGKTESEYTIASSSGNSKEATFKYQTLDTTSDFAMTRVQLSYVNTPAVGSFSLTKTVQGVTSDTTDFNGTVEVSLDNGSTWQKYPLAYTIGGTSYNLTSAGKLATNGRLRHNRTLNFAGIPVGAKVRFTEDACPSGYTHVRTTGGSNGITVEATGGNIAVTNQKQSGADTITVNKTLDGQDYTGTLFNFELNAMTSGGKSGTTYVSNPATTQVVTANASNGKVNFSLNFTTPGNYRYSITETAPTTASAPDGMVYDSRVIYTGFSVISDGGELKIDRSTLKFYTNSNFTTETTDVTFKNTVQKAKITIMKDNEQDQPLQGTVFAVVKVKDETPITPEQIDYLIQNDSAYFLTDTTLADGSIEFNDLPIYQNGDWVFDNSKPVGDSERWFESANYLQGTFTPQTYFVFEFSPTNGYNTNKTTKFVTFPYESNYSVTFDYTNVAVIDPASGGPGVRTFLFIGFGIFGSALLMAAGYVVYDRRARAKRKSRHGRRYK